MVCDSPKAHVRKHLRDMPMVSVCGPRSDLLIGILLGGFSGVICILFAIFVCGRSAPSDIQFRDPNKFNNQLSSEGTKPENGSKSSIVSSFSQHSMPKGKRANKSLSSSGEHYFESDSDTMIPRNAHSCPSVVSESLLPRSDLSSSDNDESNPPVSLLTVNAVETDLSDTLISGTLISDSLIEHRDTSNNEIETS